METLHLTAAEWFERARALKDEGWLLLDLCGVDRMGLGGEPRFEIVVQLLSHEPKKRMMVHVAAAGDGPTVPSVTGLWPTANFFEREAYDMFGIDFDGHPNLTRILMPDEWEGHPLRKDYGVGKVPVEFIPQPFLQTAGRGQAATGKETGSDVDELGQTKPRFEAGEAT